MMYCTAYLEWNGDGLVHLQHLIFSNLPIILILLLFVVHLVQSRSFNTHFPTHTLVTMPRSTLDDYPIDAAEMLDDDEPPNHFYAAHTSPSIPPRAPFSSLPPWFTAFPQPHPVTPSPQIASSTPLISNSKGHVTLAPTSMPPSDLPWARPEATTDPLERAREDPAPGLHIQQAPKHIAMSPCPSRPLLPGQRHARYWIDPAAPRVIAPQDEPSSEDMQWSPPATHDTLPEQTSPDSCFQPLPLSVETPARNTTSPSNLSPALPHAPGNLDSSLCDSPSSIESPEWLTVYHAKKIRPQLLLFSRGPSALAMNGGTPMHPAHDTKGSVVHSNYGPSRQRSCEMAKSPMPKLVVVSPRSPNSHDLDYSPGPYGY